MKRREFFTKAGISSAALVWLPSFATPAPGSPGGKDTGEQSEREHEHGHEGDHEDFQGPLASATVSVGQWNADPAVDRFPNNSPRAANNHQLIPGEVTIKAGGAVNFVISGFHHVLVYGNRSKPADISLTNTILPTVQLGPTPGPPLINDPVNRVYRGLDPSVFPMLPAACRRSRSRTASRSFVFRLVAGTSCCAACCLISTMPSRVSSSCSAT